MNWLVGDLRSTDHCTLGHEYPAKSRDMRGYAYRCGCHSSPQGDHCPKEATVLTIRIDNGPLLASKVRVITAFWQRHWPFDRQHLGSDQGLLLTPGRSIHSFGMPCPVDVVFLDDRWCVVGLRRRLLPARWASAPRVTRAVLLLAAGHTELIGLQLGMALHQDTSAVCAALPCATTLLRRRHGTANSEP